MEIAHVDTAHKRMTRLTPLEIRVQFRLWHSKTKKSFSSEDLYHKTKGRPRMFFFWSELGKEELNRFKNIIWVYI